MHTTAHAFSSSVSYLDWLSSAGPWLLLVVGVLVLIETGLLFPFLPGDTLLFGSAILAGSAGIPFLLLVAVAAAAAIIGDQLGYAIGRRFGRGLFTPDARILKTKYLEQSDRFFARFGPFAVVLARFAPIVRTFVPPLAGASALRYWVFLVWNIVGGVAWATIICTAGLLLGKVPAIGSNLDLISVGILLLSVLPFGISYLISRRRARRTATGENEGSPEPEPERVP